MAAPSVYAAINAITAELAGSGIPKKRMNAADDYRYRSIDDILNALAPLLAKHRLCVLPAAVAREAAGREGKEAQLLISVALRVAFTLVSVDDGSTHVVEAYGEALDGGDKATAKAMSAAYKSAMIQVFCIPLGEEDADAVSHTLKCRTHLSEPVQGWDMWVRDIADIVSVCESEQAIQMIQDQNRELLQALSRERAELYSELGGAFAARREALDGRGKKNRFRGQAQKQGKQAVESMQAVGA